MSTSNIRLENYEISLSDLSAAVGGQWQDLGKELRLSETVLESINNENEIDSARALEMLQLWRNSNQYNDFGLQQALININFDFLKFVSAKQRQSQDDQISSEGALNFFLNMFTSVFN
jgi:hypothetical protein